MANDHDHNNDHDHHNVVNDWDTAAGSGGGSRDRTQGLSGQRDGAAENFQGLLDNTHGPAGNSRGAAAGKTADAHPLSWVAATAVIPESVTLGPFCSIGEDVVLGAGVVLGSGCVLEEGAVLGDGCRIGHHVTVHRGVHVGARVQVGDHSTLYEEAELGEACFIGGNSSLGRRPKPAAASTVKVQADLPPLKMGPGCTVGCAAVLYAGTVFGDRSFVGDGAIVRERCLVGEGVIVGSGVTVENDTRIGALTKIQTGSYITAYMEIEERAFIAPMVTTTNDNFMGRTEKRFKLVKGPHIGRAARVGGGAILLPGVRVAEETFVAAGALVSKDTEARRVVKGFPAQDVRPVPEEELLP
ncbi:UDP-3-O-(3-hydroxymyristoyl)glucosamine N-acyltransferase [Peptococcaceae bacterium CEB3]|nr:UDP-3-O-(3-hydroxymyristoyl)glucosamine N-acyltransferase [Peptococcaceae bacterium CEB3]